MTTPPTYSQPVDEIVDYEAAWFAGFWLGGIRHLAVRTAPVIVVVRDLAIILRDAQAPASQALFALRRALRLLTVLTSGTREPSRRLVDDAQRFEIDDEIESRRLIDREAIAQSVGSRRFAEAWLGGDPADAIRTEPVICLVEQLHRDLIQADAAEAFDSVRRAVQVLSVFVLEDKNTTDTAEPGQ